MAARPDLGEYALIAPAALKGYAKNPRTHPESQIAQIVRSITEFGFTNPLLIDEADNIIAGHGRLDAAKRLSLASVAPHLMVTDPPYGVEYDAGWRDEAAKYSPSMGNRKDTAKGKIDNDDRADWREAWALFPGDVAYVWHADIQSPVAADSLAASGFDMRALIVWAKSHLVIGRGHYHHMHEPCWYAVRKGATGHWAGDRKQTTLWQIDKPQKSDTGHSTQKPVECMRRPIENNSSPGQAVYEPFSGSGTTIIACEMTGRSCHAIELNPAYVDVAIKRWQNFTGQVAQRDNGEPFQVAA